MSALQVIERFKVPLLILEVLFVAAFAAELYLLSAKGTIQPDRTLAMALLVPPLGVWACFFPLCYYAWFRKPSSFHQLKLVFFWLLLLGSAAIWVNIIRVSVDLG
jgi:hypothetical protein